MSYIYRIGREAARKSVEKHADKLRGECLDVGSQGVKGRYAELFKNIASYTSLDINPDNHPDIVSDAENMKGVSSESFDSILCAQVMLLIKHPDRAMSEFNRVLRKGGHILITAPFINLYLGDYDYWRFSPAGIRLLLEENGFEVIAIEKTGVGIFSVMHQLFLKFIKIKLRLGERRVLRAFFNRLFIVTGKIAIALDTFSRSPANDQFFLDITALARKID